MLVSRDVGFIFFHSFKKLFRIARGIVAAVKIKYDNNSS